MNIQEQARQLLRKRIRDRILDPSLVDNQGNYIETSLHEGQQEVVNEFGTVQYQWIISPNRVGKTNLLGRIVSWLLANNFEQLPRPKNWPKRDAKMLVATQSRGQFDEAVADPFIIPFFEAGELKIEKNSAKQTVKIIHKKTGNHLLIYSFNDEKKTRALIQGLKCHFVAVDEMPKTLSFITELQARVSDKKGQFLATFTPLVVSMDIKKKVDNAELPYEKKYKWNLRMNPIYADEEAYAERLYSYRHLPEGERRARLFGDWAQMDLSVFPIQENVHLVDIVNSPRYNQQTWRHVVSIDPASSSKVGLTLFAESPDTHAWYVVKAFKFNVNGMPASDQVPHVEGLIRDYYIVRRVVDSADRNFVNEAKKVGIHYYTPFDKNGRRLEMIENCIDKLGKSIFIDSSAGDLLDELSNYRWDSNDPTKIVNSKRYHITDSWRYGVDCLPPPPAARDTRTFDEIKVAHHEAKLAKQWRREEAKQKQRGRRKLFNFSKALRRRR